MDKTELRRRIREKKRAMTPEEIETFQRLLLRITDNMQKYIEEDKS